MIAELPDSWTEVRIGDVCTVNPRKRSDLHPNDLVSFVPMASISEVSGSIISSEDRSVESVSKGYTPFREGDVLFAKITPCMENGKAAIARNLTNHTGFGSTEFHVLRPSSVVVAEWIFFMIRSRMFRTAAEGSFQGAAGQRRVPQSFLESFLIPLPPLSEQQRIVDILQEAEEIRRLRAQAEAKTAQIILSIGHYAFSYNITKSGKTTMCRLEELADVQGGIQVSKRRDNAPLKAPYLRVANVHRDSLDLSEVKQIGLTDRELERTRLQNGDILVVEGHGNPNELGRAAIWNGELDPCTHQNHLIRVRCKPGTDPTYVLSMLNSPLGCHHFLNAGNTTSGLNTISTNVVRGFRLPRPATRSMEEFAKLRKAVLSLTSTSVKLPDLLTSNLTDSLTANAFSGKLTADWRQAHQQTLDTEARQRDAVLSEAGATLQTRRRATIQETDAIFEMRTDGQYAELNREQREMFVHIEKMVGGVDYPRYFTAEMVAAYLDGSLSLHNHPQGIEGHLAVFAARGLIVSVSREEQDEASGRHVFGRAWRLPLRGRDSEDDESGEALADERTRIPEMERLAQSIRSEGAS